MEEKKTFYRIKDVWGSIFDEGQGLTWDYEDKGEIDPFEDCGIVFILKNRKYFCGPEIHH